MIFLSGARGRKYRQEDPGEELEMTGFAYTASQTQLPILTAEDATLLETEKNFLRCLPAKLDDTNDEVMYDRPTLIQAAILYTSTYAGDFDYMKSMAADGAIYGFSKWSMRKFRGVLNCLRAEAIREARAAAPTEAVEVAPDVKGDRTVPVGIYTAVFADGEHRTFRVKKHWEEDKAKAGVKVVQYLRGENNESDYTGFAFLDGSKLTLWRRTADEAKAGRLVEGMKLVLQDPAKAGEAYALESSHCFRCNRLLTVPVSIHRGLGPECAAKWGM